jgi:hypothetical protein
LRHWYMLGAGEADRERAACQLRWGSSSAPAGGREEKKKRPWMDRSGRAPLRPAGGDHTDQVTTRFVPERDQGLGIGFNQTDRVFKVLQTNSEQNSKESQ